MSGLRLATFASLAISVAATSYYIISTGGLGFTLAEISRKRAVELAVDGETVYGTAGYLRLGGEVPAAVLLIALAYYLGPGRRIPFGRKVSLALLFGMSVLIPFISSSRSSIVFIIFGIGIVLWAHRRLTRTLLISSAFVLLVVFGGMAQLRALSQNETTTNDDNSFLAPLIALGESGNGLSLFGTTHIIDGVPSRMDYQYGLSYLTWITAPIPRSIWPGKPDVSLGKQIKSEILQQRVIKSGRPPSIITEGWINFGPVGLLASAFIFGAMIRLVSNSLIPILAQNCYAPAIYYATSLNLAALTNSAMSQAVVRILSDGLLIVIAYMLIQGWQTGRARRMPAVS